MVRPVLDAPSSQAGKPQIKLRQITENGRHSMKVLQV
jgi:hypothetical protein